MSPWLRQCSTGRPVAEAKKTAPGGWRGSECTARPLLAARDTNVPLGQSIFFHRALRRFGVEHEFVVYPREGHGLAERSHQLDALRRIRAWFDRWLVTPIG
jgi:hypothetical protein